MRLGDAATFINGYPFKPSDWSNIGLPIIRIQNLTESSQNINYYAGQIDKRYLIQDGDVLISWSASLGVYEWENGNAWLNQHIFKVKFDKIPFEKSFFKYVISAKLDHMSSVAHGATMKHVTKKNFDEITIPYPPLLEQRRLAEILSTVNLLIEQRKHQIEKLDLLAKSRFIEMFGDPVTNPKAWAIVKLKSISQKISDGVHAKPIYTTEGKPFISVVNITRGFVDFTNCKYVSEEAYAQMIRSTHPEKGDILYTKVGATYGIPAYIDTDKEFCLYVSVCLIKPLHDKVNAKFLSHSMAMPYIKRQADQRIKGIGVPDLHLNQIREFDILLPPVALQNRFVAFVEQLDKSKFTIRKSLEQLETLYRALLQEYFG